MKNKKKKPHIGLTILLILLLILSAGLIFLMFYRNKKEPQQTTEEDRIKNIKGEIENIDREITNFKSQKKLSAKKERRVFLQIRIGVLAAIVASNLIYFYFINRPFKLGDQVDFNTALTLIYTLIAFLIYGSLNKFISALKLMAVKIMRKNHIYLSIELPVMENKLNELQTELKNLQISINQKSQAALNNSENK